MFDLRNRFWKALPHVVIFATAIAATGCLSTEEGPFDQTDGDLGENAQALAPQAWVQCSFNGAPIHGAPTFRCEATNSVPINNQQWRYRMWNRQGVPIGDSGWWWGNSSFNKIDCANYQFGAFYQEDYEMVVEYRAYNADGVTTTDYPIDTLCRIP